MKKIILPLIFLFIFISSSYSQIDLGTMLQGVGQEYAQKYLEPLTTGLGAELNSGFIGGYGPSSYHKIPVWPHVYIGMKFCGVVMQDADKSFNLNYQSNTVIGGVNVPVNWTVNNAPTVFGSTTPAVATGTYTLGGTQYTTQQQLIGGLEDIKFIPLFIPKIGLGTIVGTDLVFSVLPGVNYGNYGSFKLFGAALRHNLGAYIKDLPFDIAVQGGYQNFGIKDKNDNKFISANTEFINLQFNKTIAIVSIYAGGQYENYTVDVSYNYQGSNISFSQIGESHFMGIVGGTLSLTIVKLNFDLNYGAKFGFTAGLGVGL